VETRCFSLGIQTDFQKHMMLKQSDNGVVTMDATFGTTRYGVSPRPPPPHPPQPFTHPTPILQSTHDTKKNVRQFSSAVMHMASRAFEAVCAWL